MKKTPILISLILLIAITGFIIKEKIGSNAHDEKNRLIKKLNIEADNFISEISDAYCSNDPEKIEKYLISGEEISNLSSYEKLNLEYIDKKQTQYVDNPDHPMAVYLIKYHILSDIPDELKDEISADKVEETSEALCQDNVICQLVFLKKDIELNKWKFKPLGFGSMYFKSEK